MQECQRQPIPLTANALEVLESRYLLRDDTGKIVESPADLFDRVARAVAEAELRFPGGSDERIREWTEIFYELMASRRFLPNSPTLLNAGRDGGMLSACFVLPVEDSIESIFEAVKQTAMIQKCGGGTGFDFSRIRPLGDRLQTSGGISSGPVSFLRVFSQASNAIQQGAFRRGANMGVLRVDHPDILEFITAKRELTELTNFNISVSVTEDFMEAVEMRPEKPHEVVNPRTGERGALEARGRIWSVGEVFERIVEEAWQTGEPGLLFIDRMNAGNPTPELGRIEATNPCGEQPLLPYEACNLGSINLALFVREDGAHREIDWQALETTVEQAVRFLDDVVEINHFPVTECQSIVQTNRKIGLGIMGFADALFLLETPYDSEEAVALGEKVMSRFEAAARRTSELLAAERGPFPGWERSLWKRLHRRPLRNAALTTIAPTGTISIIAGCSPGIEPVYALVFRRHILDGKQLCEVNPHFLAAARAGGVDAGPLLDRIAREGTIAAIEEIPPEIRRIFVCARDVAPPWHIRMQAAFQKHCDASISKTINMPADARAGDVRAIFLEAHRQGLKGVTVYRDRSRESQPMLFE